jgi:GT2 family glycosyltransferase
MFVRRSAWEQIGGFDEEQWMYSEDLDLCWRMMRGGWDVRYEPAAEVRHELGAATRKAFGAEFDVRWQTASWAWMARRRGLAVTRATAAVELGIALARVARRLVLPWRLVDEGWRARLARDLAHVRGASLGLRSQRHLRAGR